MTGKSTAQHEATLTWPVRAKTCSIMFALKSTSVAIPLLFVAKDISIRIAMPLLLFI